MDKMSDSQFSRFLQECRLLSMRTKRDGVTRYHNLAGEVEARNVEKRNDYTDEYKRETPPSATEDVPRDLQGVRLSIDPNEGGEAGRNDEQVRLSLPGEGEAMDKKGGKKRIVDMTKEEREEQEKVWTLALQSIDQARHANAPDHEPNTSKPLSGTNLGRISQITTQLDGLLAQINKKPMERKQFLNSLQGALGITKSNDGYLNDLTIGNGDVVSIRVKNHPSNALNFVLTKKNKDENYGVVIHAPEKELSGNPRFKSDKRVNLLETDYYHQRFDDVTLEESRQLQENLVNGIKTLIETGDIGKMPLPDRVNASGFFEPVMRRVRRNNPNVVFSLSPEEDKKRRQYEVPKRITSLAQAARWTYDTLSRIRGEQGRLYGFGAESKDFTSGILSADTSNGRKINVQQARGNRDWMNEYLDIVQPLLYKARDNSTSAEARKYFEEQIEEANYARQWYDRAAEGDASVLDDLTPLFSVAPEEVFISNARRAVEGIKQEKAKPDQWLAMIQKAGGLKAAEDKWLGLSDWLKSKGNETVTKEEVLDYIRQNQVNVEEVEYEGEDQGYFFDFESGDFTLTSKADAEIKRRYGLDSDDADFIDYAPNEWLTFSAKSPSKNLAWPALALCLRSYTNVNIGVLIAGKTFKFSGKTLVKQNHRMITYVEF